MEIERKFLTDLKNLPFRPLHNLRQAGILIMGCFTPQEANRDES